jgi:hypothetical protein
MINNLEARLADLGEVFDIDDSGLVDSIDARLDRQSLPNRRSRNRWIQMAAALVLIVAAAIAIHPDSRRVVASWFGLNQVRIERDTDLDLLSAPVTFELPGPGDSQIIELDGRQIMVSTIYGRLGGPIMQKTLGSSTSIIEVDVVGHLGLWISGAPHEVMYEASDGHVVVERVAGNTLLWEVGDVLYRLEGFDNLDDALKFVGTRALGAVSD